MDVNQELKFCEIANQTIGGGGGWSGSGVCSGGRVGRRFAGCEQKIEGIVIRA